jgi:hypothetical protein
MESGEVLTFPQGPVGVISAVKLICPRTDGFQEHVAVNEEPLPVATLFLQPGIITPFALKVTFACVLTFILIVEIFR